MKTATVAVLISIACALILVGQQYPDLTAGMRGANRAWKAIEKLEPKTGKVAVDNAERLGGLYEEMIAFWRQRESAGGTRLSIEGKAAATRLASAARAGDTARAEAAARELGETCNACHKQHRVKTAGGRFRLK